MEPLEDQIQHGEIHTGPTLDLPADLTMATSFRNSAARCPTRNLWGTRRYNADGTRGEYEWLSYSQCATKISNLGSGLRELGLTSGDKVGIMAKNRTEWLLTDYTCACQSFISVPVYDIYGPEDCALILNHSEAKAIIAAKEHLEFILRVRSQCEHLLHVIVMDYPEPDQQWIREHPELMENVHTMSQVESMGASHPHPDVFPQQDDLATIVYTSGTTGTPKGAMLTHKNLMGGMKSQIGRLRIDPEVAEIYFSYLPAAHIFDRNAENIMVYSGGSSGFYQGIPAKLVEDMGVLRPTMICGVPRVYNRIYSAISNKIAASFFLKRWIFKSCYYFKKHAVWTNKATPISDRLVFRQMKAMFGGRLRNVISGSSPLVSQVGELLRCAFDSPFIEGYGLTETSAAATAMEIHDPHYGTVGIPLPGMEVKLVDLPEMGYQTTDSVPRGEIWVRGPNCFVGYYKDPEQTARALTEDGWVRTGDVGQWLPTGCLQIIDRVKNIFKLSQGEFVCAERIESLLSDAPSAAQVMVHGERTMPFLVAVVVPDTQYAKFKDRSCADLARDPEVKKQILADFARIGKKRHFRRFESIEDVIVSPIEFTPENKMMTPSSKLRRPQIKTHFQEALTAMCSKYAVQ